MKLIHFFLILQPGTILKNRQYTAKKGPSNKNKQKGKKNVQKMGMFLTLFKKEPLFVQAQSGNVNNYTS